MSCQAQTRLVVDFVADLPCSACHGGHRKVGHDAAFRAHALGAQQKAGRGPSGRYGQGSAAQGDAFSLDWKAEVKGQNIGA